MNKERNTDVGEKRQRTKENRWMFREKMKEVMEEETKRRGELRVGGWGRGVTGSASASPLVS